MTTRTTRRQGWSHLAEARECRPDASEKDISPHFEPARAAVLRRHGARGIGQLALSYANHVVRCELNTGQETIWSGAWDLSVSLDGDRLRAASDWEQVCWVSDSEGDYLELQAYLERGVVVQRQLFLARQDNFLYLADAILGGREAEIDYCSTLPLVKGTAFTARKETSEGLLRARCGPARVLPLAIPEWRSAFGRGSLERTECGLQLRQGRAGRCLYAPLFIDLELRRLRRPLTWRSLTVAENGAKQTMDAAVGYRVQVGHEQWLVYRSLGARGNRTVLGQNLSTEFVLARFTRAGEAEKLVEVE